MVAQMVAKMVVSSVALKAEKTAFDLVVKKVDAMAETRDQ